MSLPVYTAESSLGVRRSYMAARLPDSATHETVVIVQHDPCHRDGGGGDPIPTGPCPRGRKCCGPVVGGRCLGGCVPVTAACP
jgi:hypothetical protein